MNISVIVRKVGYNKNIAIVREGSMELHIRNIAKIEKADIEINGITVIAGENNTGKSTVGKVLYCLYTAFHNLDERAFDERCSSIAVALSDNPELRTEIFSSLDGKIPEKIWTLIDRILSVSSDELESLLQQEQVNLEDSAIKRIKNAVGISDEDLKRIIIGEVFEEEFCEQVKPIGKTKDISSIEFLIKGKKSALNITEGYKVQNEMVLSTECIIIDNPFAIDEIFKNKEESPEILNLFTGLEGKISHDAFLDNKLCRPLGKSANKDLIGQYYLEERLNKFKDYIIDVVGGNIVEREDKFVFHDNELGKDLELKNLSAGIKTFTILLKLLENGDIQDGSMIVLDEPEIHLHPSWQLKFAELLVLLQKEFDLNIVLATHSPYFMNALQVYSAKHAIADKTKYYLAELNEKGKAVFEDVTLDPERVYKLLAQPFQILAGEEGQE